MLNVLLHDTSSLLCIQYKISQYFRSLAQSVLITDTHKLEYNDPIYVKLEKLDIMIRLTNSANIAQVLAELKE